MQDVIGSAAGYLLGAQHADGGWAYASGATPMVEPTCAALLALRDLPAAQPTVQRAIGWLLRHQHDDGGWGCSPDDPQSGWHTSWSVLALAYVAKESQALDAGIGWLSKADEVRFTPDSIRRFQQVTGIDLSLRGWPWLPSQAAWVEPTALAVLALASTRRLLAGDQRLADGVRFLLDRRCPAGGWNVGDPRLFGQLIPPRACPTAWSLLAIASVDPALVVGGDWAALEADALQDGGAAALAWAAIAFQERGRPALALLPRLQALQSVDGSWNGSPYQTAIAAIAVRGRL